MRVGLCVCVWVGQCACACVFVRLVFVGVAELGFVWIFFYFYLLCRLCVFFFSLLRGTFSCSLYEKCHTNKVWGLYAGSRSHCGPRDGWFDWAGTTWATLEEGLHLFSWLLLPLELPDLYCSGCIQTDALYIKFDPLKCLHLVCVKMHSELRDCEGSLTVNRDVILYLVLWSYLAGYKPNEDRS